MAFPSKRFGRNFVLIVVAASGLAAWLKQTDNLVGTPNVSSPATAGALPVSHDRQQQDDSGKKEGGSKVLTAPLIADIWDVSAGESYGTATCSLAAHLGAEILLLTAVEGDRQGLTITLTKPNWDMPINKPLNVSFVFDKRQPLYMQGRSFRRDALDASTDSAQGVAMLDGLLKGSMLTVGFFDPFEPKWKIPLKGSKDALAVWYLCIARWQRMSK